MSFKSQAALVAVTLLLASNTARATKSAELYRTTAYKFGRFEARIRYGAGNGVISSFFLWKDGSEASGAFWNELDFEKLGADCHLQSNLLFGPAPISHREQQHNLPNLCTAYHDYRFEWTPEYIAFALDGQEIRRATGAEAKAFADNATQGMTFHFNIWPGDATFGGVFDPSIVPVQQYVSWAQYSAYQNGTFQVSWREDFDGSSLPSGWAVGDWSSPLNLSTHSASNVSFKQGVAVLSLTADNATGFNGNVPADVGGAGSGGGGGGSGSAGMAGGGGSSGASGGSAGSTPTSGAGGTPSGGAGGSPSSAGVGGASAGSSNAGSSNAGAPSAGASNAGNSNAGVAGLGTPNAGAPSAGASSGAMSGAPGSSAAGASGGALGNGAGSDPSDGCTFAAGTRPLPGVGLAAALALALASLRRRKRH